MNKSSKYCLSIETTGHGLIPAANPFFCAQLLNHPKSLSLIFFIGVEVQEVSFTPKQVSSHLDFICPFKLANKPKVSKLPNRTRMYPVLFFSFL